MDQTDLNINKTLGTAQGIVTVRIWQRVNETGSLNTEEGDW